MSAASESNVYNIERWVVAARLFWLGHNLAIAGALCAAHRAGTFYGMNGVWWPGCGRQAMFPRPV